MENQFQDRYNLLRQLAAAGISGQPLQAAAGEGLKQAVELVGLQAAAVFLWDKEGETVLRITHATSDAVLEMLTNIEKELYSELRKSHRLSTAYLTFDSDPPLQSFTLPLKHHQNTFGAVIGISRKSEKLISEDLFLEAVSSLITLNVVASDSFRAQDIPKELVDKERLGAVLEMAVTVNHEINNPLTAILGNVQLLLLKGGDLDPELKSKLQTIEISALKIRDVTQKLLRLTTARSITYTEGTNMLDLSDSSDSSEGQ